MAIDILSLIIAAAFTNNIVLTNFLGVNEIIDSPAQIKHAKVLAILVSSTLIISSVFVFPVHNFLTNINMLFLQNIVLIIIVIAFSKAITAHKKTNTLGIKPHIVVINSVLLGTFLINPLYGQGTIIFRSLGVSIGFSFLIYIFTTIRIRLQISKVPKSFVGMPIHLIVMAFMAMAFRGFLGIG